MPSTSMTRARGLYTFSNYFSSIPEGALLEADNVVIDRDGIIEPRRGIKIYGQSGSNPASPVNQLFIYKDRLLTFVNNKLMFDDSNALFTAFTVDGTNPYSFNAPSIYRIKGIETQGNFYFTTDNGIKKISVKNSSDLITTPGSIPTVNRAGGVKALDMEVSLDLTVPNGFLPANSSVAYRVVFGTKDNNDNLILGFPSNNTQIYNSSSISYGTTIIIQVPQIIVGETEYFYQIYRSTVSATSTADDELRLIYEAPYDGILTTITIQDNTPEDIRDNGTPLYTNEYSGQGITQANSSPPLSQDICLYKNITFYANTKNKQTLSLTLQGLDGILEFDGLTDTPNKINAITYSAIPNETTFTLDSPGHDFPVGTSQEIVMFVNNSTTPVVINAEFRTSLTIVVSGNYSSYSLSEISIFPSYIIANHQSPVINTKFFFVGRATNTEISVGSNKATMVQYSSFKLHSADDKIKYLFWYKINTNDVLPDALLDTGYVPSIIDITDPLIVTAAQIASATSDALNNTGNFVAITDTVTPSLVKIVTSDSGKVTSPSATFKVTPDVSWSITQTRDGIGEDITSKFIKLSSFVSIGQAIESTAKSMTKIIDRNVNDFNLYYASSVSDLPGQFNIEAVDYSTPQFSFTSNIKNMNSGSSGLGSMFNPVLDTLTTTTSAISSAEVNLNRFYYSKEYEPESVPSLNYIDVGPKDKAILRIIALRDSLFIFKEEGVYRLTGTTSANFYVALYDSSTNIVAPDTAVVLNNQIYMLSSQGVASVTETGVGIISRPIENIFTRITTSEFTNYSTASFGCAYESDRAYLLFTVNNTSDTYATKVYRYNTFTQAWTSWTVNAASAIVNPATNNNKIYFGSPSNYDVLIERKALSKKDYADKEYPIQFRENGVSNNTIQVSTVSDINIGDIILQTQYLTTAQFERLLNKLDNDSAMNIYFDQFYNTYKVVPTDNLGRKLKNLTLQLNSINPIFTVSSGSNTFSTIQSEFNTLIGQLNLNAAPTDTKDYQTSTGTIEYEILVSNYSFYGNTITTNHITPILSGPAVIFKGIESKIIWAPIAFGDPSMLKQIREGTIMFERSSLASASIGYASDLSPGFETIDFNMEGDGSWGNNVYSNFTWGGLGSSVPLRTLIPRQKQRCRFIESLFKHNCAFYKFSIVGISYVFEPTSNRGYR